MNLSIQDILKRFNYTINGIRSIEKTVNDVVFANSNVILDLNRTQLLSGRNSEGNLLSPGYLQDPYFRTPQAAQRYADWKDGMQSYHDSLIGQKGIYPPKPSGIPNLIITGLFQDGMFITTDSIGYTIDSDYKNTKDIESKYNGLVFGLAPPSRSWFYLYYLRNTLLNSLYLPYGM